VRDAFRRWLGEQGYTERTQATQWAQASRMEKLYGDLDAAFDSDRFASIRRDLARVLDPLWLQLSMYYRLYARSYRFVCNTAT
jgi:hypothetical protein